MNSPHFLHLALSQHPWTHLQAEPQLHFSLVSSHPYSTENITHPGTHGCSVHLQSPGVQGHFSEREESIKTARLHVHAAVRVVASRASRGQQFNDDEHTTLAILDAFSHSKDQEEGRRE